MNFKTEWGEKAYWLNEIISHLNDEGAYYSSGWLYIWPDGTDASDVDDYFDNEEDYKELENLFIKVYKSYRRSGLYSSHGISDELLEKAHEWDKKLGLAEIKDISKEKMSIAQDAMEEEIVKILNEAGVTDFEIEDEHDRDNPDEPYKCLYFDSDEDAKKAYRALKKAEKWPTVKAIQDFWGRDGYSDIEVLVSTFAEPIEEALLNEASTVEAGKADLPEDVQQLVDDKKFTEAWQKAKEAEKNGGNDGDKAVLYLTGTKFSDGYLAVKGGAGEGVETKRKRYGFLGLGALFTGGKWKRNGIKLKNYKDAKNGEFYLLPRSDVKLNPNDVAVFPLTEVNEVKGYLGEYNPSRIQILGLKEFAKDAGIPETTPNFREQVLAAYINDLGGEKKIDLADFNNIRARLFRVIDTYGLAPWDGKEKGNPFLRFLNTYADKNGKTVWSDEDFMILTNIVVKTGKASLLANADDTELASRLLLNSSLYAQPAEDAYHVFNCFNYYWNTPYRGNSEALQTSKDDASKRHSLAGGIVLDGTNIIDVIEERDDTITEVSDTMILGNTIRKWEDIKAINQKLRNLEGSGGSGIDAEPEETSRKTSLPKNTKEFDISTLDKSAYKKVTPTTGTDDSGAGIRRDVVLDRGDVFMGTNGKWYIAGNHGNYDIKLGSEVYLRQINTKDFGGYNIGELAVMSKADRDAVIATLEPREQAYLNGIFK